MTPVVAPPRDWHTPLYGALALAFHEPPGATLFERLSVAAAACRDAGETAIAGELDECLAAAAAEEPAELRQDFDDLFRVPAAKYVTPYESVWADPPVAAGDRVAACTFGPSTTAVDRFYRRVGLSLVEGYGELPDYAGAELACLEYLCSRERDHVAAGETDKAAGVAAAQAAFVRDHVSRWFPALCARIAERSETRFFRALAHALERFVGDEARRLGAPR